MKRKKTKSQVEKTRTPPIQAFVGYVSEFGRKCFPLLFFAARLARPRELKNQQRNKATPQRTKPASDAVAARPEVVGSMGEGGGGYGRHMAQAESGRAEA